MFNKFKSSQVSNRTELRNRTNEIACDKELFSAPYFYKKPFLIVDPWTLDVGWGDDGPRVLVCQLKAIRVGVGLKKLFLAPSITTFVAHLLDFPDLAGLLRSGSGQRHFRIGESS